MTDNMGITRMGEKGQIVIPQAVREALHLEPQTRFAVFCKGDTIVLKPINMEQLKADIEQMFALMHAQAPKMTEEEIAHEIKEYRREKRHQKEG